MPKCNYIVLLLLFSCLSIIHIRDKCRNRANYSTVTKKPINPFTCNAGKNS